MSIHGYQFEPNQRHAITSQHKARLFRPNMAKHVSHHSPMVVAIMKRVIASTHCVRSIALGHTNSAHSPPLNLRETITLR
jgi:hypothetical protein